LRQWNSYVLGSVFDPAGVAAREAMLPDAEAAARLSLERANGLHEAVRALASARSPGGPAASERAALEVAEKLVIAESSLVVQSGVGRVRFRGVHDGARLTVWPR
jgi:hypothetical protein